MAQQQVLAGRSCKLELQYGSVILFSGRGLLSYGRGHAATQRTLLVQTQTLGPFPHDMLVEISATTVSTYQVLDLNAITADDLALVAGVALGTRAWVLDGNVYSEMWFDGADWIAAGLGDAPSDGSTYGRRNGDWSVIGAGGITNWGDIGGEITDQADLDTALGLKADSADLGSAATHAATDFATSAQGAKADSAVQPGGLATVATSGAYGDLSGRPSLATVATSGSYSDLTGKPSLATVATSGSYTDLSSKPTLGTAAAAATTDFATAAQGAKADSAVQPAAIADFVSSSDVSGIVVLTQAEYDALSPPDSATMYAVIG